jgi:hypothetical protein
MSNKLKQMNSTQPFPNHLRGLFITKENNEEDKMTFGIFKLQIAMFSRKKSKLSCSSIILANGKLNVVQVHSLACADRSSQMHRKELMYHASSACEDTSRGTNS